MKIQSEIIYPESIMAHLTSFEFCPVFDKNRAKARLCVCSGVKVTVTYGHDRFSWWSRHIWTMYTTWPNGLCISAMKTYLHSVPKFHTLKPRIHFHRGKLRVEWSSLSMPRCASVYGQFWHAQIASVCSCAVWPKPSAVSASKWAPAKVSAGVFPPGLRRPN